MPPSFAKQERKWAVPALALASVVVTLAIVGVLFLRSDTGQRLIDDATPAEEPRVVPKPTPLAFDPPPGSGVEHDDELPFLVDGDVFTPADEELSPHERAAEEMREFEQSDEVPRDLSEWPDGKAKYITFGEGSVARVGAELDALEFRRILLDGAPVQMVRDGDQLRAPDGRTVAVQEAVHLPPVEPSKIIAVHLNYRSRVEEFGIKLPASPTYFHKPVSALNAHGGTVVRPPRCRFLNYEGEIAIVIGSRGRDFLSWRA